MFKNVNAWTLVLVIGAGVAVRAEDDRKQTNPVPDLRTIRDTMIQKWDQLETFQAKVHVDKNLHGSLGVFTSSAEGTYWHMKKDGEELFRQVLESRRHSEVDKRMVEGEVVSVADGHYLYTVSEHDGLYKGTKKMQQDSGIALGGRAFYEFLDTHSMLEPRPETDVDGHPVFVIEGVGLFAQTKRRTIYYISKEYGVLVRREALSLRNEADEIDTVMTLSDFKVNSKLDPELFVFKAPLGVQIKDQTQAAVGSK